MAIENLEPKTRFEYFLNKIAENKEQSSNDSNVFLVNLMTTQDDSITLSETFGAIKQAYLAGQNIRVVQTDNQGATYYNVYILNIYTNSGGDIYLPDYENPFHAQSDSDYPAQTMDDNNSTPT